MAVKISNVVLWVDIFLYDTVNHLQDYTASQATFLRGFMQFLRGNNETIPHTEGSNGLRSISLETSTHR